jgi:hypothetical protein
MFITGVNDSHDKLFPVSTTPAINPCHGFSVTASVVDTSEKLAPMPLTRVPINAPFHEGFDDTRY